MLSLGMLPEPKFHAWEQRKIDGIDGRPLINQMHQGQTDDRNEDAFWVRVIIVYNSCDVLNDRPITCQTIAFVLWDNRIY